MSVQPGAFGVTSTNGWEAQLIQLVTASTVNHAFVCVSDGVCVEARPNGAGTIDADAYPKAIWDNRPLTDDERTAIVAFANEHIGTPYGWLDCLAAGLDCLHRRTRWFPRFQWAAQRLASYRTMDCSQLVAMAYAAAGITLVDDELPCQVTPGELLDSIQ